jgi:hypothetical protein
MAQVISAKQDMPDIPSLPHVTLRTKVRQETCSVVHTFSVFECCEKAARISTSVRQQLKSSDWFVSPRKVDIVDGPVQMFEQDRLRVNLHSGCASKEYFSGYPSTFPKLIATNKVFQGNLSGVDDVPSLKSSGFPAS